MVFTCEQMKAIIEECRLISSTQHLNKRNNKNKCVYIPDLTLNIVSNKPIGVPGNLAIFVNAMTFRLLKGKENGWIINQSIVIHESVLHRESNLIEVIGMILHETGHAFNVAAGIPNTEKNAYIFEIEVMLNLYNKNSKLLFGQEKSVGSYFYSRLPQYEMAVSYSPYLQELINDIKKCFPSVVDEKSSHDEAQAVRIRLK